MARCPREMEKVTEMKLTLGTGREAFITTDGKKTQQPIRWNRLNAVPAKCECHHTHWNYLGSWHKEYESGPHPPVHGWISTRCKSSHL